MATVLGRRSIQCVARVGSARPLVVCRSAAQRFAPVFASPPCAATSLAQARSRSSASQAATGPQEAAAQLFGAPVPTPAPEQDIDTAPAAGYASEAVSAAVGTQDTQVRLRDGAVRKLNKLKDLQQKSVLQLMVNSGGCSGYSYEFHLIDDGAAEAEVRGEGDAVLLERDGARLLVDGVSLGFLEGCEIDYVEEMIRSSFQVVANKLADAKCGCGSSFSVSAF